MIATKNSKLSTTDGTRINGLLVKYRNGGLSTAEMKELERLLSGSHEHREIFRTIKGGSDYGPGLARMYSYNEDRVWKAIMRADKKKKRHSLYRKTYAVGAAASIVIAVTLSLFLTRQSRQEHLSLLSTEIAPGGRMAYLRLSDGQIHEISDGADKQLVEADRTRIEIGAEDMRFEAGAGAGVEPVMVSLHVPVGGESKPTILDDGTKVWLNSGSGITFPTRFSGDVREVTITGEAYFEVMHNPERPFIVNALGQKVTVLGTSFNISAYPDDATMETTLVSGKLKVAYDGMETMLEPGRQARIDKTIGEITVNDVLAESYMLWVRGEFFFRDEPLESICKKFGRWYDVEFEIDPSLKGISYTGVMKRYTTFNKIAELMAKTGEFTAMEKDGKIKIIPQNR